MRYDVIIGGGGPSGAISAYLLAREGINTLLIEKETYPRYKPCGGGIPLKTKQLFPFDISPTYELKADGAVINYQGSFCTKIKFDQPYGWLVMRDKFDHYLAEQAEKTGTKIIQDTTILDIEEDPNQVVVSTNHGKFTAQYLIGSDGVNSLIAQKTGLLPHRKTGTAIEAEVNVTPSRIEQQGNYITFDFGAIPWGYGWIFPKRDHLSVGIFQANQQKARGFRQKLSAYMNRTPILKDCQPTLIRGHRIPLGGDKTILQTDRVLLVGDAANLADSWLGEGIYYATKSAKIAADVLKQKLAQPATSLSVYTSRIHQEISRQLVYAAKIAQIIYRLPRAASLMTAKSSIMQSGICTTVYGQTNNEQLYKTMLKNSIKIIFQTLR